MLTRITVVGAVLALLAPAVASAASRPRESGVTDAEAAKGQHRAMVKKRFRARLSPGLRAVALKPLRTRGGARAAPGSGNAAAPPGAAPGTYWAPHKQLSWYWQLAGTVDTSKAVAVYDIDAFDTPASTVATLHAQGKKVICYFSAGTSEDWRPDYGSIPASVRGATNGWPGEQWLDVRQLGVLGPIMSKRMQLCKSKGFDAIEPDNMDGWSNSTGFPISQADQVAYDRWLAQEAHRLGLSAFQKNAGELSATLASSYDGAVVEECNQYGECGAYAPYLNAGKPVLNAEYGADNGFCANDQALGIMGARFALSLDGSTFAPCWA